MASWFETIVCGLVLLHFGQFATKQMGYPASFRAGVMAMPSVDICTDDQLSSSEVITCGDNSEVVVKLNGIYTTTCDGMGLEGNSSKIQCMRDSELVFVVDLHVSVDGFYTEPCKFELTWNTVPFYDPHTDALLCSRNTCTNPDACMLINPTTILVDIGDVMHGSQVEFQYPMPYDSMQFIRGEYFPDKRKSWPASSSPPTWNFGSSSGPSTDEAKQMVAAQRPWAVIDPSHAGEDNGYCRRDSGDRNEHGSYLCCFGNQQYQNRYDRSVADMDDDDVAPIPNDSAWEADMDVLRQICQTEAKQQWNYAHSGHFGTESHYYLFPFKSDALFNRSLGYFPLQDPTRLLRNYVLSSGPADVVTFDQDTILFGDTDDFFYLETDPDNGLGVTIPKDSFDIELFNGYMSRIGASGSITSIDDINYHQALRYADFFINVNGANTGSEGFWISTDSLTDPKLTDSDPSLSHANFLLCGHCASAELKPDLPSPNQAALDIYNSGQHRQCHVDQNNFHISEARGGIDSPDDAIETKCAKNQTPKRSPTIINGMERYRARGTGHWSVGVSPMCGMFKRTGATPDDASTWVEAKMALRVGNPGSSNPGPIISASFENITSSEKLRGERSSAAATIRFEVQFKSAEQPGDFYMTTKEGVVLCDSSIVGEIMEPSTVQDNTWQAQNSMLFRTDMPMVNQSTGIWLNHTCTLLEDGVGRCTPDVQFDDMLRDTVNDAGGNIFVGGTPFESGELHLLWYYVPEDVLQTEYVRDSKSYNSAHDPEVCTGELVKNGIRSIMFTDDDCDTLEDSNESQNRCMDDSNPCGSVSHLRGLQTDLCTDTNNRLRLCRASRPPSYVAKSFNRLAMAGPAATNQVDDLQRYLASQWNMKQPQYELGRSWNTDGGSIDPKQSVALYRHSQSRSVLEAGAQINSESRVDFSMRAYITDSTAQSTFGFKLCAYAANMVSSLLCAGDASMAAPGQVSLVLETMTIVPSNEFFIASIEYNGAESCQIWLGSSSSAPPGATDQLRFNQITTSAYTRLSYQCTPPTGGIPGDQQTEGIRRVSIWQRGILLVSSIELPPCKSARAGGVQCDSDLNASRLCALAPVVPGLPVCSADGTVANDTTPTNSPVSGSGDSSTTMPQGESTATPTETPTATATPQVSPATMPSSTPTMVPVPISTSTSIPDPVQEEFEDTSSTNTIFWILLGCSAGLVLLMLVAIVACCISSTSSEKPK